jgi:hypothetical protein
LRVDTIEENPAYQFISDNARGASKKFGVKSVSMLAFKTRVSIGAHAALRGHPSFALRNTANSKERRTIA